MASVASQLVEEVTAHAQIYSLEVAQMVLAFQITYVILFAIFFKFAPAGKNLC